jgi:hypothetical protein
MDIGMKRVRASGWRLVASATALVALAACGGGGSTGGGGSAGKLADHYVGRYIGGAALLSWTNANGRLKVTIDLTHANPTNPGGIMKDRLSLDGRLEGDSLTLQNPVGAPWSGAFRAKDLILDWAPSGGRLITTTFSPGDDARYRTVAADFTHELAQVQQAGAQRSQQITADEALKAQQAQAAADARTQAAAAAHLAQVAASQQAHADQVAAMRAAHDAAVAAMNARNAAARANAAAHHP